MSAKIKQNVEKNKKVEFIFYLIRGVIGAWWSLSHLPPWL